MDMYKKRKLRKESNEEKNLHSVAINCLITIYATPLRNPYNIMGCKDLELA